MNCTVYTNTGFNAVNIPDSTTILNQSATTVFTTTALDCLQSRFLTSITISTTWENIKNADYCVVDDFYYFINGITMTSHDVARLSLVPDFITSIGVKNLSIVDGVTERYHIAKDADAFGLYNEADSLLAPINPLQLHIEGPVGDEPGGTFVHVVESTIDLASLGNMTEYTGRTFTDTDNSSSVTVPSVPYATENQACTFTMGGYTTKTKGTAIFNLSSLATLNGLQIARDLGIENGVIAQYSLPTSLFTFTYSGTTGTAIDPLITEITETSSSTVLEDSQMAFEYTTGIKNIRALYGENNKYGLLSASGNSIEYNPEEIYVSTLTAPSIIYHADGRHNGRPYYSFSFLHGVAKSPINRFFLDAVDGMEWRNVPLTYVTKSGSVQDAYKFQSQRREAIATNQYNEQHYVYSGAQTLINGISNAVNRATMIAKGAEATGAVGLVSSGFNTGLTFADQLADYERYRAVYAEETNRELYDFGYSQTVITPSVMFPYQTPSVRDYMGNGVIAYRYYLSDSDLIRIDKLLTAYGYRITTQLTADMFTTREHFNYIKANGVSISNSIPNWWKDGINAQFGNGVRIWHVKPDPSYITERDND